MKLNTHNDLSVQINYTEKVDIPCPFWLAGTMFRKSSSLEILQILNRKLVEDPLDHDVAILALMPVLFN